MTGSWFPSNKTRGCHTWAVSTTQYDGWLQPPHRPVKRYLLMRVPWTGRVTYGTAFVTPVFCVTLQDSVLQLQNKQNNIPRTRDKIPSFGLTFRSFWELTSNSLHMTHAQCTFLVYKVFPDPIQKSGALQRHPSVGTLSATNTQLVYQTAVSQTPSAKLATVRAIKPRRKRWTGYVACMVDGNACRKKHSEDQSADG